jgi:TatD DNase family protein
VADAVGLPVPELAAITTANTRRLFKLPEAA